MQVQGLRRVGGRSGAFSRRGRQELLDLGLELHGEDPRSTFHIDSCFAGGEVLLRITKLLDGDGVPPALGAQAMRRLLSWWCFGGVGEERRPWLGWSSGIPRDLVAIFFSLGSLLLLFLDRCPVSKLRVCLCVIVVSFF